MFTGIIQVQAPIISVVQDNACFRVQIKRPLRWKVVLGQSIAIDGICSTVMNLGQSFFEVEYMSETLSKTTVSEFEKNTLVNLERSLTLEDLVDGHLVLGHVDGTGIIDAIGKDGNTEEVIISVPKSLTRYIVTKGSVTVNGVSLTVAKEEKDGFRVALIPHTLKHTNLGILKEGESVNIEVDVVARYVEKLVSGQKKTR
jgi:riboflavin synthase